MSSGVENADTAQSSTIGSDASNTIGIWDAGYLEVQWVREETLPQPDLANLEDVYLLDEETASWYRDEWMKQQHQGVAGVNVGDIVRPRGAQKVHQSQVDELLACDPTYLLPIRAVIRNMAGRNERQTVALVNLKLTSKSK